MLTELLTEIDRLRAELQTSLTVTEASIKIAKIAEGERDQLREKLAMAEDFIGWLTPCGQVNVSPTINVIGQTARHILAKIRGEK